MTVTKDLSRMKTAYFNGKLAAAQAWLEKAEKAAVGRSGLGRKRRAKKFTQLVQAQGLTRVVQILKDYKNKEWINQEKTLYGPVVEAQIREGVERREAEFRKETPALVPSLPWRRQAFWQVKRQQWRQEAMAAMEDRASKELDARAGELANLQVRLSLILTLTTVILAVMSLWSKGGISPWVITIAAIIGCTVLNIALTPMKSKFRQAWRNKFVDPIVWASLAEDPLGRLCILGSATLSRNGVITRYKRVLWALVPFIRVILVGVVILSAQALPLSK